MVPRAAAGILLAFALMPFACTSTPEARTAPASSTLAPVSPCPINSIHVIRTTPGDQRQGEIGGMVITCLHDSKAASLAIDTGSALTFLYLGRDGERYKPHAGTVQIGCETLALLGRNLSAGEEEDVDIDDPARAPIAPIIGVLGADFFLGAVTDFDPARRTITRHALGVPLDHAGADAWSSWDTVPFENVEGHIIITIIADGKPRRLMWDTGCPHLLIIGEEGRPGDTASTAMDVEGGTFTMHEGTAEVIIGGDVPRTIPALRAVRFPYFEGTVEALGGHVDGLAGQSVFGFRRIVVDPPRGVIHLEPRRLRAR